MIALEYSLRHLRAGGGDCVGRSIARWSSVLLHARLRLPRGRATMSVPRISNNSFWGFGFG